jgi:SAM-dependent methyltransferase
MKRFAELKASQAEAWSSAPWEEAEHTLAPVHEHLIAALEPKAGERWLDIATGVGAVARLAAQAGADVTGLDLSPRQVEVAVSRAAAAGLDISFEVGDAEELPHADASFDVVSSSMGLIFAPDHARVARELGRVCHSAGRIGFTAWRPDPEWNELMKEFRPESEAGAGDSEDWGREDYVRQRLGESFELRFEEGSAPIRAGSGEELWELFTRAVGPCKAMAAALPPERRAGMHDAFVSCYERCRTAEGIDRPEPYLVVIGTRR